MKLKKQTDFALRVLMYLATYQGKPTTIKDIADGFEISQNHLMKVVQLLRKLEYIESVRGKNGGIWLKMPPQEIILGDVLRQTGEQGELAECTSKAGNCRIAPACKLRPAFKEATEAFFQVLDKYTLADIMDSPQTIQTLLSFQPSIPA